MRKIEAPTLEEAYRLACEALECSINELNYEIVQHPKKGILGLFAKPAIIVADKKATAPAAASPALEEKGIEALSETVSQPDKEKRPVEPAQEPRKQEVEKPSCNERSASHEAIVENFFDERAGSESKPSKELETVSPSEPELAREIEEQLKALLEASCFDMDVVEVDVIDDTAYVFIDGEDAALLIGKEGYRYNALSYLLFNWLHSRYQLYLKLEIAQFLSSQQEMIRHYLEPVIEHVEKEGWGRTRPLDGILVQIALEQLREAFPEKYVAIKRQRDGSGRYVLVNEFNRRR